MKCFECEKNIDLLLDDEANDLQKQELKAHLATCETCQTELQIRQQTQILLKNQPLILPVEEFDKRMLAAFENKLKRKSWWSVFLLIPKPAFVLAAAVCGLALAFLLGRMSVALPLNLSVSNVEKTPEKIIVTVTPTPEVREVVVTKPEIRTVKKPEIQTVTKYVNIPVTKEKVVEKIVYVGKPNNVKEPKKEVRVESANEKESEEIAKQFNLKDLQPVANVSYKIIRKGENNEK